MRLFTLLFLLLISCTSKQVGRVVSSESINTTPHYIDDSEFDFSSPSETFELPKKLNEISGLDYYKKENIFIAINDEKGRAYSLDFKTKQISIITDFKKKGDFEGISVQDENLLVIESNGLISKVDIERNEVDKIKTLKKFKCDFEGIKYDNESQMTLALCKDSLKKEKGKTIFLLKDNEIAQRFNFNFSKIPGLKKLKKISPSGIGKDPISKNYYITSANPRFIIIIDPLGQLLAWKELDKKLHRQPEAIAFDDLGNMYIANEAKGKKAVIHKFIRK